MSVLAEWHSSKAAEVARKSLPQSSFNFLCSLAQNGSPAIVDALEQYNLLDDDAELLNTFEIISKMEREFLSQDFAREAERKAMWAPVSDSDRSWSLDRMHQTAEFQRELDQLNLERIPIEEQVSRYRKWLGAHSKPAQPIFQVTGSPSERLRAMQRILRFPSTDIAKSTGAIAPSAHPDLSSAAASLAGASSGPAPSAIPNMAQSMSTENARAPRPSLSSLLPSMRWSSVDSLMVFTSPSFPPSDKIAGFDMDHTLIEPKSGSTFPRDAADWRWLFPQIKPALLKLYEEGYNIVILSNQSGISKGKQNPEDLQKKIEAMMKDVGIPLQAILATADDKYRKPSTAVWDIYVSRVNKSPVTLSSCFYCGDAAGRGPKPPQRPKKDFSCTDRAFAANLGISFHTESEFFLNEPPASFTWDSIDPAQVLSQLQSTRSIERAWHSQSQEMIVFVGAPGSGKSTFARAHLIPHGYVHINRDTLSTQAACISACRKAILSGQSVVVDNTSPARDARVPYIQIAREHGIPVRCFRFKTDIALAKHLNLVREKTQGIQRVPDIGYNIFQSRLEEPAKAEGFAEIIDIPFVPRFESDQDKQAFLQRTS